MKLSRISLMMSVCFALAACASTPRPVVQANKQPNGLVQSYKDAIQQLDATFCHIQLTDMQEAVIKDKQQKSVVEAEDFFVLRMGLRQKTNQWIQKDSQLSPECQKLSFDIQNLWRKQEEQILSLQKHNKHVEQRVFTDSQWQLYSNPLLMEVGAVTSVSELQNGDVVLADEKVFVIEKNANDEMHSWIPDTPTRWVRLSMRHPLGWLKQPAKRVVVLRHWNSSEGEKIVNRVQSHSSRNREPSSSWGMDLESNANFLQVFEWRNHSLLTN